METGVENLGRQDQQTDNLAHETMVKEGRESIGVAMAEISMQLA